MPRTGFQSTGIKTVICPAPPLLYGLNKCRTLSCSGIALSVLFSFCHFLVSPDFSLWCRSVKSGIFDFNVVLWLFYISGRPFSSDAYLSLVGLLELLAKINVWQRDIRVDPEKSPSASSIFPSCREHPFFCATRLSGVKQLKQPHCLWTHEVKKSLHRYESHRTTYK